MDWNLFKKLVLPEHFAVLIGHFDENFKKGKLSPGKPFISSRSLKLSLELFDYWLLSLVLPTSQQWLQILSPPSRSRWIFLRRRSTKGSSQRGWRSWTRAKLAPTRGVRFQVSSIVMLMTQIVMMMTQIVMMMTKLIGKALIISNSGMTWQECEDKIQRMLLVKAGAVKPELPDYNDMRRYQVLEINLNDGTTVKKKVLSKLS